ncbi:MAG: molybdopterin molybdotransferase MoeA, partial [Bacteroidota bacterium]
MIDISEASTIVLNQRLTLGEERVPLEQAIGRVLREDLRAERDFPPFDRVTMDGIAIQHQAFAGGQRKFPIQGTQAAGAPQMTLEHSEHCMEVMTGAMLPVDCDTVIRYEDIQIQEGVAELQVDQIKAQQNVHHRGTDRKAQDLIVAAGGIISSAEIGVAATIGKNTLLVARRPKVVIITTGDELVEVDQQPLPHQIRSSNVYKIKSALHQWNLEADRLHLVDDLPTIEKHL